MINIVVGGFFGDEGKGKIVGYLANHDKSDLVVRAGSGPQAGHTVTPTIKVTQVPSGLVNPKAKLYIARGTLIDPDVFLKEVKENNLDGRIFVDAGCTIIEPRHKVAEAELVKRIGSVGTGVGPARVDRVLRTAKLAKEIPRLKKYIVDVADTVNAAASKKKNILIEGVQGYGLSLLDHNYYPFVTSQDTTASQFAADTGIGPKAVDNVIVIFKAYLSRVGTDPKFKEWSAKQSKKYGIEEHGSVSGRKRKLGDFDARMARESIVRNTATMSAVTCVDRLFPGNGGVTKFSKLTPQARKFLEKTLAPLDNSSLYYKGLKLISTGPNMNDVVDLRR